MIMKKDKYTSTPKIATVNRLVEEGRCRIVEAMNR
jgi:hypothetical protein